MEHIFEQFKIYLLTEKRVSKNTLDAYCSDMNQFFTFCTEHAINTETITYADIKTYLALLKKNNLSSKSTARKVSSLKAFFNYANRYHGIKNIAESLIFPKLDQRLPKCLSESEIETLLRAASADTSFSGIRNNLMLSLMYVSGARISELIHIRMSDIHQDTSLICLHGKGGKSRMIPVPTEIISLLIEFSQSTAHSNQGEDAILFPVRYGGVFKPMTRQACWGIVKRIWAKTQINKPITPHMLRHSLATHMLKNGADLRSLQILLGHENLSTVQIYTHVETSYLRSIYDAKHPRS
jgi:integrase/recombinase XerD